MQDVPIKHLKFCNDVLTNSNISEEELISFVVEYCVSKNINEITKHLNEVIFLIKLGKFNLRYAVEEYLKDNNKEVQRLLLNGIVIDVQIV